MSDDLSPGFGRVFDMAAERERQSQTRWMARLARTSEGALQPTTHNAGLILRHAAELKGLFAYNEFSGDFQTMRPPPALDEDTEPLPGPYPRALDETDTISIVQYFEHAWTPRFKKAVVFDAIVQMAMLAENRFHPVRDYLDTLVWDGLSRLDNWLHHVFGCPDDDYHRAVGSKVLIAAVRRVYEPGIKFDTMLVVEGQEGIGKSTAFATLFDPWFSDNLFHDLQNKDAPLSMQGKWCMELAEIHHIIRSESAVMKAFLSRQADRIRPHYGKLFRDFPRQSIFVGTTNDTEYLHDPTGNRRFWPVRARWARDDWVAQMREQLWAEARARALAKEVIYLDEQDLRDTAYKQQEMRRSRDVWEQRVLDYCRGKPWVTTANVLSSSDGLDMKVERQDRRAEMRIAKILTSAGWTRKRRRIRPNGKLLWVYEPPKKGDNPFNSSSM